VIENPELRAQIQPIAFGQPQVTESSHLLVFAAWNEITEEKIDSFIQLVSETRNVPVANLSDYRKAISGMLNRTQEAQANWAARQVYLAMGTALAAAAHFKIDSTPMEGFMPAKLDELLDLSTKGLHSVLMLAVGEREEKTDFMANAIKVRYPKDQLFIRM
jgi:nitroreductase